MTGSGEKKRKRGGSRKPLYFKKAIVPPRKKKVGRKTTPDARSESERLADLLKLYLAEKEKNTKLSIRRFYEGQRIKAMVDGTTASLPCRASLYNAYKMHIDGLPLRPRGKAGLLTDPETTELLKRLRDLKPSTA